MERIVSSSDSDGPRPSSAFRRGQPAANAGPADRDSGPVAVLDLRGEFSLRTGSCSVALPPVAQRLVAFLALQDRPVARRVVAGVLWGDRDESHAAANLRSALWRANAAVPTVCLRASGLALDGSVEVLHREELSEVRRVLDDPGPLPRDVDVLVAPLRADLLTGWYDEWTDGERERLRQLRLRLLDALAARLLDDGRFGDAIDVALTSMVGEPLRPVTNEVLVLAHLREGNRREATRHFERYDALMRRELGVPAPSTLRDLITTFQS